jgi:hypothetical protein
MISRCEDPSTCSYAYSSVFISDGHGCHSIDNDCDDVVDGCEEDNWKPEMSSGSGVTKCSERWFQTQAEARACVESVTSVSDDCDDTLVLSTSDFALSGSCASAAYTLSRQSDRCGHQAVPKGQKQILTLFHVAAVEDQKTICVLSSRFSTIAVLKSDSLAIMLGLRQRSFATASFRYL